METDGPYQIVTENLNTREKRQGIDKVQDTVEFELLKEYNVIHDVQELIKKTIAQVENQIKKNRAIKEKLELNWSNKLDAEYIDTQAGNIKNLSTNKQFCAGVALYQENMSDPETWAEEANDFITQANMQLATSVDLRSLLSSMIVDASRSMREQFDKVNIAFEENINYLQSAKFNLENCLKRILDQISILEKNLLDIKEAIREKDDPLKVAQTRLRLRTCRPQTELCKDPPSENLIKEVNVLSSSLDALLVQYEITDNKLKDLQGIQINLEKEIDLKKDTINIDQVQCVPKRRAYPSTIRLQGY